MINGKLALSSVFAGAVMVTSCHGVTAPNRHDGALYAPRVEAGQLSEETIKEATRVLSSDEFEGREPGSAGEEKTLTYISYRFKAAGLQPGNNGSWVQEVPLVEVTGKDYQPLTVTSATGGGAMSFAYGADWVGTTYRAQTKTRLQDSELVFVGYGINAPERGWNDYAGLDVKGKTVLILVNDPDWQSAGLDGPFNGKAMTYYGRWTYKYEEAARQGAAGALIVHQTAPASYGWNVVESSWSGPQAFPQYGGNPPPRTQMNGWVSESAARRLLKAAGQDLDELTKAAQVKGFQGIRLGHTLSTSFASDVRRFSSHNVIGILPGSENPDEYVLHTAHWDHLGRCTPAPDGDDICNGAIDNATGIAALIALAEAHVKAGAPRRSLVFLAVTAEESGMLGSMYYAQNPVFPLAQSVGGVNMDALQMAGPAKDVTVVGLGKSELDRFLVAALEADGRTVTPDAKPEAGYYYRSDHFALAKVGVPMIYVKGGFDLVAGGRAAGEAAERDYREKRYHGPKDEFSEAWDWSGIMADLKLYYRLGRMMAMSTSWPNWTEGDEFRSIREDSCKVAEAGC